MPIIMLTNQLQRRTNEGGNKGGGRAGGRKAAPGVLVVICNEVRTRRMLLFRKIVESI